VTIKKLTKKGADKPAPVASSAAAEVCDSKGKGPSIPVDMGVAISEFDPRLPLEPYSRPKEEVLSVAGWEREWSSVFCFSVPLNIDLMEFAIPDSEFGNELAPFVKDCRAQFASAPTPRAVLGLADMVVSEAIGDGYIKISDGNRWVPATLFDINRIERDRLVRFVASWFDIPEPIEFVLHDELQQTPAFSVSARQFYAAIALVEAFKAIHPPTSRIAAFRCGRFAEAARAPSAGKALTSARKAQAQAAARMRVMHDPKAIAMAEIKVAWNAMISSKNAYVPDAEFARQIHRKHPVLSGVEGIKNAISRWRKENSSS
jgi:hypothetical protein